MSYTFNADGKCTSFTGGNHICYTVHTESRRACLMPVCPKCMHQPVRRQNRRLGSLPDQSVFCRRLFDGQVRCPNPTPHSAQCVHPQMLMGPRPADLAFSMDEIWHIPSTAAWGDEHSPPAVEDCNLFAVVQEGGQHGEARCYAGHSQGHRRVCAGAGQPHVDRLHARPAGLCLGVGCAVSSRAGLNAWRGAWRGACTTSLTHCSGSVGILGQVLGKKQD